MAKYKVLSTKKLESSLVKQAKQNNIEITEQEFISVTPIRSREKRDEVMPWILSRGVHHVVFTSANAAEAIKSYLHKEDTPLEPNWNIFCISGKTKSSLQPYLSEARIIATAECGKDLAKKIIEHGVKEIVFFCGNKRRDELPAILKNAGIQVHEVVVYENIETPVAAIADADAILFFSPSAVQSFFSVNSLNKAAVCFAIGETTADSIKDFTDNKIIVSQSPSQETMLASVNAYFQNKACDD